MKNYNINQTPSEFFRKYSDMIAEAEVAPPQQPTGNPAVDKILQTPEAWTMKQQGYTDADIVKTIMAKQNANAKLNDTPATTPGFYGTKEYYDRQHEMAMLKQQQTTQPQNVTARVPTTPVSAAGLRK